MPNLKYPTIRASWEMGCNGNMATMFFLHVPQVHGRLTHGADSKREPRQMQSGQCAEDGPFGQSGNR